MRLMKSITRTVCSLQALLLLACLLCTSCTGALVDALEERNVSSCIWWSGALTGAHGVTATGGVPLQTCLQVPCPCALGR